MLYEVKLDKTCVALTLLCSLRSAMLVVRSFVAYLRHFVASNKFVGFLPFPGSSVSTCGFWYSLTLLGFCDLTSKASSLTVGWSTFIKYSIER